METSYDHNNTDNMISKNDYQINKNRATNDHSQRQGQEDWRVDLSMKSLWFRHLNEWNK